ncbi:hypothetical protein U9M48_011462 [Paspalum notatum var. saurae]
MLYETEGVSPIQQRLISNGQRLEDGRTLADYNIQNDSTIHMVLCLMQIFVKCPTGRTICLTVRPSDTLSAVKAKIQECHCLVFDGKELLDDKLTLADYDILHRSTIDLQERMQINVLETLQGMNISLQVDSSDTIDKVKAKIQDAEGFPKARHKQLEDKSTLTDHGVSMDSTLLLVLHPFPEGPLHLYVRLIRGRTLTLKVKSSETIDNVKLMIYLNDGMPPKHQRLIFAGHQMEGSGRTLADYNANDQMKIFVRCPTGRTISLRVQPSDTLSDVKAKILEHHRLVFDGKELDDNLTLADYDIQHRSTLELQEKMQIYVLETRTGRTITLEVDGLDTTIDEVKSKIQGSEGFLKGQQCLLFDNKQLDDNSSTLEDHNISKESTLLLVLHPLPRGTMRIFAKTVDGRTIPLDVESSDTISIVKSKMYEKGFRPAEQRFIFDGRSLEDKRTVADYDIEIGDYIDVFPSW